LTGFPLPRQPTRRLTNCTVRRSNSNTALDLAHPAHTWGSKLVILERRTAEACQGFRASICRGGREATAEGAVASAKAQRPNPLSHLIFRSYEAILSTSLTAHYPIGQRLFTLGTCGGLWYELMRGNTPADFQGTSGAHRTTQDARLFRPLYPFSS
jgi:hypothetical protein